MVDAAGNTPEALGWGKPLALLCLLVIRQELPRDEAVDLLWRDIDEAKARNAFRQALHRLRNAVGDDVLPQDRERLRLAKSDSLIIDLDRFHVAIASSRFEDAVETYVGDFLQDAVLGEPAYDLWVEQERVRIRTAFRGALERAMALVSARGDWSRAIGYARRLMQVAPYEPEAAQLAAATIVSAGQAREARELLMRFATRREAELGVGVPPEIRSLMARLDRPREGVEHEQIASASPSAALRFAGRESELAQLLTLWRTVGNDSGALALIEAEAGMGKTRLTRELAAHAKALRPGTVLVGHERASPTPLGLFADALRPLVRAPGVAGASPHLLAEAARLLPELRDTMELPGVSDVEDEAARLRFFEGIAALIDAASYERPLLMILEDLQHVSPSSLDLLTYLASRLVGSPVMFVLTMRSDCPVALRIRALSEPSDVSVPAHGARATRLTLGPLPVAAVQDAVSDAARAAALAPALVDRICREAQGHPGRVADLLRRTIAGEDVASRPATTTDVVAQQLERLTSAHRRFFVVVALLRRPTDLDTLASAAHLSLSAARDAVRALDAVGLVEATDDGLVAPAQAAADAAIADAGSDARAFLSRWIAVALEERPGADAGELARFFASGGQTEKAFEYYRRAAFSSLALGASVEAVTFLSFARTFAITPQQQADIEGLLTGLGSGKRRLVTPGAALPFQESPVGVVSPWLRLFPNWRLMLGGAIATLLLSTFLLWSTSAPARVLRSAASDTLVLAEGEPIRALRFVTFDAALSPVRSATERVRAEATWIDSLSRPWSDPVVSPLGTHVALARATANGTDLYVLTANRGDTVRLSFGSTAARPLGWSPDGRWVLASTSRALGNGSFDSDLFAFSIAEPGRRVALDTAAQRAVVEARWAPDGLHVGWVARLGDDRQLEVFASRADGSAPRNVSRHPADDYHIAWSGDGDLLAFTSTRDGNAELYAFGVTEGKLWRLTRDPAQDDWASYSSNGRMIAFESTRGGAAGVYVMPGLGGEARRVESRLQMAVREWRSGAPRYVDKVRVVPSVARGDTMTLRVVTLDQFGDSVPPRSIELRLFDSPSARLVPPTPSSTSWTVVGARHGIAQLVASAAGWRSDTSLIRIGAEPIVLLRGQGIRDLAAWMRLGDPPPGAVPSSGAGVSFNADRDDESGLLARAPVPLLPGLTLNVSMRALADLAIAGEAAFGVSLVAPEAASALDRSAPQFLKYASVSWNAEARRLVYAVGREVFSEVGRPQLSGDFDVTIRVERDSTVSFAIGGRHRWRSSLRAITDRTESRAQAWISAHATGGTLLVREATMVLDSLSGPTR